MDIQLVDNLYGCPLVLEESGILVCLTTLLKLPGIKPGERSIRSSSVVNTKVKGNITELRVMVALCNLGYRVSVPWGENSPYDLVVEIGGILRKVQCKTGRYVNKAMAFNTSSTYYTANAGKASKHQYITGTVDYFGVFGPELDKIYLIPDDIVGKSGCYLRIDELTTNRLHMKEKTNWAHHFEIK